jgi:hypothetical protein
MPVLRHVPAAVTPEQIVRTRAGRQVQPGLLEDAARAIALGQTLWQPALVYDWFELTGPDGEEICLKAGSGDERQATLQVGPKAGLLTGARRALVAVATIGPALGQRVQELQAGGESLQSYFLDSAGVVALGAAGEALRCLAEEVAREEGWGVSPAVSPGSLVGWTLKGQRELCSLLPLDEIGVRLNDSCVLEPHKYFSALIGLGPGLAATKVGSVCKYCALQDTCWRRREDGS